MIIIRGRPLGFALAAAAGRGRPGRGGRPTDLDPSLQQGGRPARARHVDPADGLPGARRRQGRPQRHRGRPAGVDGAALAWYRREKDGWTIHPIDRGLNIEAGGVFGDLDGDGDLDIIFGEDYSGSKLYWWENPWPHYESRTSWTRREIKASGGHMHHDQVLGDFDGDGRDELAFWVQEAEVLRLAEPPQDPRRSGPWPTVSIASIGRAEGLAKADVNGDGKVDVIGGGYWFRHEGGSEYRPMLIDEGSKLTRAAAGQLVEGGPPEVVFVAGDVIGRLKWFERRGDTWVAHDLLGEDVIHGHSLQLADIDRDGHLDIFCAEMAKWTEAAKEPDNPKARMWIFYGDGRGGFEKTTLATGIENHESRSGRSRRRR